MSLADKTLNIVSVSKADFNAAITEAETKLAEAKADAKRAWNWVGVHWVFFVPGAGLLGYLLRAITHG